MVTLAASTNLTTQVLVGTSPVAAVTDNNAESPCVAVSHSSVVNSNVPDNVLSAAPVYVTIVQPVVGSLKTGCESITLAFCSNFHSLLVPTYTWNFLALIASPV